MSRLRLTSTDPLALALAAVVLGSALVSLEVAGWVEELPRITLNSLVAIGLAWATVAVGLPRNKAHLAVLMVGIIACLGQVTPFLVGQNWTYKVTELVIRLNNWGYAARTGGISSDPLAFYLFLLAFAWLGGYVFGWSISRGRRPWVAIALTGVALLMNLNYGPPRLGVFFLIYILASLLLIVRLNQRLAPTPGRLINGGRLFAYSGILALSLSLIAWFAPTPRESSDLLNMWYRVNTPWQDGLGQLNRAFAFLVSKERPGPGDFDRALVLRATSNLSDDPVMVVESTELRYWRGLSYDYYTGQGWLVQDQTLLRSPFLFRDTPALFGQYLATKEVTQTFSILAPKNNLVFAAGQARRVIDLEVNVEATRRSPFNLSMEDINSPEKMPSDVRPFAEALQGATQRINGRLDNSRLLTAINAQLPQAIRATGVLRSEEGRLSGIQVATRFPADLTAVYASSPLQIGQKYTIVSAVSEAPPERLREAGVEYPFWVTDRYLQLPNSLPERVRTLSKGLSESAGDPYDKAVAIEGYLRGFAYSTNLPTPPGNVDRVDYLLFTLRKGYSAYFSTTMVVMLRAIGVPARIVTGYTTGNFDREGGGYLVKESNAHGWVEVYFPHYGWIEFEPTPSMPTIGRPALLEVNSPEEDLFQKDQNASEESQEDIPLEDLSANPEFWGGAPLWGFVGLVLLGAPAVLWTLWRRRWAGLDAAVAAYGKISFLASVARIGPRSNQTPREYGVELQSLLPRQRGAIGRILQSYERVRYGGLNTPREEAGDLGIYWQEIRTELIKRLWLLGRRKGGN